MYIYIYVYIYIYLYRLLKITMFDYTQTYMITFYHIYICIYTYIDGCRVERDSRSPSMPL